MSEYKGNRRNKNNFKQPRREGDPQATTVNSNKFKISEAVQAQPLEVKIYNNQFDKALRAFRALVQKERVLSTFKEKASYEKRSDKRRRKVNESKRKQLEFCSKGECQHSEHSQNRKLRNSKHSAE
jgi:ribosomal protein S21